MVARTLQFVGGHKRWLIVTMLAGFGVVNYLDRQALPVLAPPLRKEPVISTEQYSYIGSTFPTASVIGYAISGRMLDRIGVKLGLALVAAHTSQTWLTVTVVALLVAAHGCWGVNKPTLASEIVPRGQVARLVSLAGIAGSIDGVLSTLLAGRLITSAGCVPVFTGLGFLHSAAFVVLRLTLRRSIAGAGKARA